ncbi:hypothetical protein Dsin_031829 [Dipteronia sinensis]|uniref:Uncharacterized protein n=1 Tax=Dipteronia sinensis TaxID=43782 RepID=A0AAD9ZMN8_9ROSI|nr:hypothetical protein Dsin_031829 [Dipteronia sinensis]
MAAKLAISSSLITTTTTKVSVLQKQCTFSQHPLNHSHSLRRTHHFRINANLGGGGDGELKPKGKRKFVTREEEPEEFWQTAGEREGQQSINCCFCHIELGNHVKFASDAIKYKAMETQKLTSETKT